MYKEQITREKILEMNINYPYTLKRLLSPFGIDSSKLGVHSRDSVISEISRFCELNKIKNRYRILSIYDDPLPSHRKQRKDSIYSNLIAQLLPTGTFLMSRRRLMEYLGQINNKYIEGYYNHKTAHAEFFSRTYTHFSKILIRALDALKINYHTEYIIVFSDYTRPATNEEIEIITRIQNKVMRNLDCDTIRDIFNNHLNKIYYARCNKAFRPVFDCQRVYEALQITNCVRYSDADPVEARHELNRRCYEWAKQISPALAKKYILTKEN